MALAIVSECAQAVLPMYADAIPRDTFAGLTMLAIMGAMISRLIYQKDL